MSDEIKKPEVVNATEEKPLDDNPLEQVVGGAPKHVDKASPKLFEATTKGTHIPEVIT